MINGGKGKKRTRNANQPSNKGENEEELMDCGRQTTTRVAKERMKGSFLTEKEMIRVRSGGTGK